MSYYRLYFMEPFSGHIARFAEFEASDDAAAGELAAGHAGENPLELWCERRKVRRIERLATAPFSRQAAR